MGKIDIKIFSNYIWCPRKKSENQYFVIPDLIRNPVPRGLVPRLREDDVWMPTFVGMTSLATFYEFVIFDRSIISARRLDEKGIKGE